jgi:arylsulfatase A-like enzyme/tetratricopeptide (TPR) repeat protein
VLALALPVAAGCGRPEPAATLQSDLVRGGNVLLVTIDTLRRDRLGAYGNANGLTPTLDRLSASGVRYTRAFSHVPMTLPAHTSILTGRTPRTHGVHDNGTFRLDDRFPTLASVLHDAGYRTGAFIGAFVLDARFGLTHGFDEYDDRYPHGTEGSTFGFAERRAADVVTAAGDWILRSPSPQSPAPGPWFAWVHLFDPHAPYEAPAEYRAGRAPYDAEVAYTDAMLGRLLDRLNAAHALDHTLIVVTADHGESLGEHGEATHGLFAYDATLAVPLILSGTPLARATSDVPVGHADILPTVADLVGVAAPPDLDGRSLVHPPPADRILDFEALDANLTRAWAPLTGLVSGGWKYIDLPLPELYDLAADPREERNLADREPSRRETLARALARLPTDRARPQPGPSPPPVVDEEAAARLRSLGYATASARPRRTYTESDDPKQLVLLNEQFNAALAAFNAGRRDEALSQFLALIGRRPDFLTARTSAATALVTTGRPADAVALLRAAPGAQATSPEILAKLGTALREAGDVPNAAVAFERSRAAGNQNPELFNDLGVVYGRLGRPVEARAQFRELLRRDPNAAGAWNNLGVLELSTGHLDAAADAFRHAVQADPSMGDAWQGLGAATVDRDRPAAIDAWRRAERLRPHDYDLLFNLGMVLAESSVPGDALPYLTRFIREAPRDRYAGDFPQVEAAMRKARR